MEEKDCKTLITLYLEKSQEALFDAEASFANLRLRIVSIVYTTLCSMQFRLSS